MNDQLDQFAMRGMAEQRAVDELTGRAAEPTAYRPNTIPIYDAVVGALAEEADEWTYPMPDDYLFALARAVTKRLQQALMLNYIRPWEADDDPRS